MQESYFHWAFGVLELDYVGAIALDSAHAILFAPRLPASYAVWMGPIPTPDVIRAKYAVDQVHYVDEVLSHCSPSHPLPLTHLHSWIIRFLHFTIVFTNFTTLLLDLLF